MLKNHFKSSSNYSNLPSDISYTTFAHEKFNLCALMDPAGKVSEDFYDFFFVNSDCIALVIADASGKGEEVSKFRKAVKLLIKNQIHGNNLPAQALENANVNLCKNNFSLVFATALVALMNLKNGEVIFANAGHNAPLLYKSFNDSYEFIYAPHGPILGIKPNVRYTNNKFVLKSKDIIFLYTDGVVEAADGRNVLFSSERLQHVLNDSKDQKISLQNTLLDLRAKIINFTKCSQTDDITMLAVEKN